MKMEEIAKLEAEVERLTLLTGPTLMHSEWPMCNGVSVLHPSTGLRKSSTRKSTPLENHVIALRELAKSLCN